MSQNPEGLNHYTMVYDLNSNKLKDKVVDTNVLTGMPWKTASAVTIFSVLATKEAIVTPELILGPQKHQ